MKQCNLCEYRRECKNVSRHFFIGDLVYIKGPPDNKGTCYTQWHEFMDQYIGGTRKVTLCGEINHGIGCKSKYIYKLKNTDTLSFCECWLRPATKEEK